MQGLTMNAFKTELESSLIKNALEKSQVADVAEVQKVLDKVRSGKALTLEDGAVLLSQAASDLLEELAQEARRLSLNHFGKSVVLYTPIYLSNYCINGCRYCNYGAGHDIKRRMLNEAEIEAEAKNVAATGLRQVLLLTGESDKHFDFEAICRAVEIISPYFDAVMIESYALSQEEYHRLEVLGVLGVTLYQETYDRERYEYLHPFGPKSDYDWRLGVPERVGSSGLRQMSLGVLMGLTDWKVDLVKLMAHGHFMQAHYPEMEFSFSLPRMIDFEGANFEALGIQSICDRDFVQAICALRLVCPQFGMNLSTRETKQMRQALLSIGINKMSAGVSTEVGGHLNVENRGEEQFKISDHSSVSDVREMIFESGYQPIMRDWIKF